MSSFLARQFAPLGIIAALGVTAVLAYVFAAPLPGHSIRTNINCLLVERDRTQLSTLASDLAEQAGISPVPSMHVTGCTDEAEVRLTMEIGKEQVADVRSALVDMGCRYQEFSCKIPGDPAVSAAVQPAAPAIGVHNGKVILWLSADPRRRSAPTPT